MSQEEGDLGTFILTHLNRDLLPEPLQEGKGSSEFPHKFRLESIQVIFRYSLLHDRIKAAIRRK